MGLFGKMFEKKTCDICGGEIGLLGNRKLDDGNLCKDCAAKLSPWFSDRRRSSVSQIRDQLAWREQNADRVAAFNPTRTLGFGTKVLLDEDAGRFLVATNKQWRNTNPDVLDFSQVTGCDTEIRETKTELHWTDSDGEKHDYEPPRLRHRLRRVPHHPRKSSLLRKHHVQGERLPHRASQLYRIPRSRAHCAGNPLGAVRCARSGARGRCRSRRRA